MLVVNWVGRSLRDFKSMPQDVQTKIGHLLHMIASGLRPPKCKTLSGFGNARIHEIRQNDRSGTFRVVYTTIVKDKIYVLHAFQKKSTRGIQTPKGEMDLIKKRLEELKSV